jgi:hypothetical protein
MSYDAPLIGTTGSRYLAKSGAPQLPSLPPAELENFSPAARTTAARAWTMRAEEEHRSASIFAALAAAAAVEGLPLDVVGLVNITVADELRHAALCTALANDFGAPAPRAQTERVTARMKRHADGRMQALAIILVEGAIGETVSSALFNAGRHATVEPRSKTALAHIARDEARHARRFWETLSALPLDDGDRAALGEETRHAFGEMERSLVPVLRRLEAGEPFDPALGALGVLDPEVRVDRFYHALESAVRPRLARLGIDGDGAWRRRYEKEKT